jgi:hypothetical protein
VRRWVPGVVRVGDPQPVQPRGVVGCGGGQAGEEGADGLGELPGSRVVGVGVGEVGDVEVGGGLVGVEFGEEGVLSGKVG